jgi:hypothetical protein
VAANLHRVAPVPRTLARPSLPKYGVQHHVEDEAVGGPVEEVDGRDLDAAVGRGGQDLGDEAGAGAGCEGEPQDKDEGHARESPGVHEGLHRLARTSDVSGCLSLLAMLRQVCSADSAAGVVAGRPFYSVRACVNLIFYLLILMSARPVACVDLWAVKCTS